MIKFLKNAEVTRSLIFQLIISVVATVACFKVNNIAGIIVIILSLSFIAVYCITTYRRYKCISDLADNVNRILHDDNSMLIENYCEGELAILHSEVYKMTVRLREQRQNLIKDKIYLADSIADISHQIRTPLTTINLMIELISDPKIEETRKQQLIYELRKMISRIDWLITTLLKISKLDTGTVQFKSETVSVQHLMEKACFPLLVPIELREQELSIKANGTFYGDIAWTCEAISNIVKNCMEHTPKKGKIEISAYENTLYTEIIISDTGSGIAKEDLPHIFERFYKGKNSDNKSFGVGLALARMIISCQNGVIKAENNLSGGAKFSIKFYKGTV